jgi:UDP-2-acetamido-3-amino-2,3-dideoxy-glucuronate N-acetyltransferase
VKSEAEIAVVGTGAWGSNHVRAWRELGVLRAVADADPARLAAIAQEMPDVATHIDWREMVRRPEIRGVVVATPATTHAEIALGCLEAGKDVLVEKPLATSVSEAEKLVDVAEASGSILMVGHVLEYHPAVLALRRLVAAGSLGKVLYVYSNRLNFGKVRTEESALWSFAPHDVALLLRLVGTMPKAVSARGGEYLSEGVADVTLMSLEFPGSVAAHVFVSWLHPFKEHRFVVVGDRQMAAFDDTAPWEEKLLLYAHRIDWVAGKVPVAHHAEATAVELRPAEPLLEECRHFLDSIQSRREPLTDGKSGVRVLAVLDAAQRSLDDGGRPIQLKETSVERRVDVHPTSVVSDQAVIGDGTRVWHFSHVMPRAQVGRDCMLGQNVFVSGRAKIGDGVKIQNNVSIYDGVVLEDHVFCGPSVVFTNVSNPRSEIERKLEFRSTRVKRGATLGANATIVCGTTVGRYALVGAGAVVTRDVPDHALVVGVPAHQTGWICTCGKQLQVDDAGGSCDVCSRSYVLEAGALVEVDANWNR